MVVFTGAPEDEAKKKKLAALQAQNQYVINNTPFVALSKPSAPVVSMPKVWTKLNLNYTPVGQTTTFKWGWGGADLSTSWSSVWYRNPVATSQKPVVWVDIVPKKESMSAAPDYTDIASLDTGGLQDYINTQSVRQQTGQQLTADDLFKIQKAQQLMAEKVQQEQIQGAQWLYQSEIAQAQQERDSKAQQLKAASTTAAEKYRNSILWWYADKKQQEVQRGQQVMNAAWRSLSFSGVWRSTYGAEKQAEIQDHVNTTMDYLNQEMEAAVARYEAELQGADNQILSWYDDYIKQLQTKMADSVAKQMEAMNEYNLKNSQSYQEKVDNILQLAQQQTVVPVTEEDMKTVEAYATLAINSKGEINSAFLQTVPAYLVPHVLQKAAVLKWAIDTTAPAEYQYVPWSEFQTWGVFNKATGKFEAWPSQWQMWGWGWWGGWATLADRNNNPWNLRSSNAVPYTPWEGWFAKFATPEDWFRAMEADLSAKVNWQSKAAANALWRQVQNLQELISVYAPSSDGNNPQAYAQSVASMLGISPTTPVSQLAWMIPQLAKAMAKHEGYTWWLQEWLSPMFQAYAKNGDLPDNKDLRPLGLDRQTFVKQYEVRKDQQPDSTWVTKEQATANRAVMWKLQTDPTITNYLTLLNAKRSIDAAVKSWINENNKSVVDQSIIMLFNKALDPTSVVREGEYARSSQWQALLWRIEAWYNTYAYWWQNISDATRAEMVKAISTLEDAAKQGIKMTRDRLKATAVDMGWTEQFVDNYFKWYIQDSGAAPWAPQVTQPSYWPVTQSVKASKGAEDYLSSLGL